MPSFLSKVFGRKKDETNLKAEAHPVNRPSSDASLLEGKFEAVPQVTSPTTPRFEVPPDVQNEKEKEKEGFGLFKSKSIRTPPDHSVAHGKQLDYHLSLNLPGPKEESTRALGVVFEADPDAQILLPESAIAERRLSPLEAFLLVQACSQAINARGLETLGIMIPHWYSASPSVQRKLISLFIQSLASKSPITTLSPTASSAVSAFESEINTTRSPHDIAAVLRWGLRHLQLDNSSFGKDEQWYNQFLDAEKASEYPPKAFTEKLAPLLPPAHLHLLTATLEIFSSLAAHAEANSISGSKLSKMLGLWLLSAPRVDEGDDCLTFYAKWEKWGRVLEHLFLARIRDEAADHRMPTRLMELVKHYPYAKTASPDADPAFLPSPRFSTRRYDALFVRIETEMPSKQSKSLKNHPLRLIADALKASTKASSTPDATPNGHSSSEVDLWESLKKHVSVADADSESYPGLSSLFADETIRFLSLIPTSDIETKPAEPTPFTLYIPTSKVGRRRSLSLSDQDAAIGAVAAAHAKAASTSTSASDAHGAPATSSAEPLAIDWGQFSTSGFFSEINGSPLASTLLDNKDVEVTIPRKPSARRKLPPALIPLPSSRGRSFDLTPPKEEKEIKQGKSRATKFEIVQLDEAFIDFWSDALLDPISADWPGFVVCKIKSSVPAVNAADSKRIGWLIIEQRFVTPRPPSQLVTATTEKEVQAARPRPNSPKPSFASDSKSTKKTRFSFFSSLSSSSVSTTSTTKTNSTKEKKKAGKGPKVGEMGEILKEEEEPSALASGKSNDVSSAEVAAAATGVVAVGAAAAITTTITETPKADEPTPATLVQDAAHTQVAPSPQAAEELQPSATVDVTSTLVEDAADAQVPQPTEPAPPVEEAAEPEVIASELASPSVPIVEPVAPGELEVVAPEPTPPPPAVAELEPAPPVVEAAPEPEVVALEPTPPATVTEPAPPVVETAPEPEIIPREPTPPPPVVAEPEPKPTPPSPVVAESEPVSLVVELVPESEPVVEAEPEPEVVEPESEPPVVEEPVVEAEPEPEVEEPVPAPIVEQPVLESEPEPEIIAREPTPPPPVIAEPEPAPAVVEAVPEPEPVVEAEPEPELPSAPVVVEEPVAQAEPEPEVVAAHPAAEPEVDEPVVEAEPEPVVVAPEPTPPAAPVFAEPEPAPIEESLVDAVEPEVMAAPPAIAEPEPVVEEAAVSEADPAPPPAAEPEPEPPVEEAAVPEEAPTPEAPAVVEPEPEMMVINEEPVAVADPVLEEPATVSAPVEEAAAPELVATPVEEAEAMPIVPEAPLADGLQFDTTAEVIGSGHIEPLREPEAPNDALVDLPAVPVVEARPDLVRGSTAISHLELTPSPDGEMNGEAGEAVDGMLPGGETLGPQATLSIAEESAAEVSAAEEKEEQQPVVEAAVEEDAPAHETNGNGVNGHGPEDADKPAE